ncbi:MAG: pyrimidine 5'-nucleotidase [Pseudomonadota bacterium]
MPPAFDRVQTWVFDLDETLYPATTPLFPQIEARMERWIIDTLAVTPAEAARLRHQWWHDHGTTLAGLMIEHGQDPDPFLRDVHQIDFSILDPAPDLRAAIAALPGRKIIFTNGTAPYAERVLAARGLSGLWDAVHGIEHADHIPKPQPASYARIFARDGLDPTRAAMFEDTARNLVEPHRLGLRTIHVAAAADPASHIHNRTDDLTGFLRGILTPGNADLPS